MKLFDVYPLFDIEPVKAKGAFIYDKNGKAYLDFYGGHAVISIGHSHPHYVSKITNQLQQIGFYSNSVINTLQEELGEKLGKLSGLHNYDLFLCNSGAEANENALKMASFKRPNTNKVISLKNSFHGRTSAAVNVTDNHKIKAAINLSIQTEFLDLNHFEKSINSILNNDITAIIIEAIQGVGGLSIMSNTNLEAIYQACKTTGTPLIMDEVQCGYGRSGKFFAYQYSDIRPDIITTAKGMGNGFPIAGVLLNNEVFEAQYGMLGTTFGGNHLACAAGIAVLEIIENEDLLDSVISKSKKLRDILENIEHITEVKGMGLMLGPVFKFPVKEFRTLLVKQFNLMTGSAKDPNMLRLLPPLNITNEEIDLFEEKLNLALSEYLVAK